MRVRRRRGDEETRRRGDEEAMAVAAAAAAAVVARWGMGRRGREETTEMRRGAGSREQGARWRGVAGWLRVNGARLQKCAQASRRADGRDQGGERQAWRSPRRRSKTSARGAARTHLESLLEVVQDAVLGERRQRDHVIVAKAGGLGEEFGRISVLVPAEGARREVHHRASLPAAAATRRRS